MNIAAMDYRARHYRPSVWERLRAFLCEVREP